MAEMAAIKIKVVPLFVGFIYTKNNFDSWFWTPTWTAREGLLVASLFSEPFAESQFYSEDHS